MAGRFRNQTYVCFGRCLEDVCACVPRICDVTYAEDENGDVVLVRVDRNWRGGEDPGYPLSYELSSPCLHGSLGVQYEHPTTEDGRLLHLHDRPGDDCLHKWAQGDAECRVVGFDLDLRVEDEVHG